MQATGKGLLRTVDFLAEKRGYAGTLTGVLRTTASPGGAYLVISSTLAQLFELMPR